MTSGLDWLIGEEASSPGDGVCPGPSSRKGCHPDPPVNRPPCKFPFCYWIRFLEGYSQAFPQNTPSNRAHRKSKDVIA